MHNVVNSAERRGREEGREEGRKEANCENARKMKAKGFATQDIAEITGRPCSFPSSTSR
jgi:predicted transposase/invertase (TIGR01784 family)